MKSSDGYSIHVPVKNRIRSLDIKRLPQQHPQDDNRQGQQQQPQQRESNWQQEDDSNAFSRQDRARNQIQFENNLDYSRMDSNSEPGSQTRASSSPSQKGDVAADSRAYSQEEYQQQQQQQQQQWKALLRKYTASRKVLDDFVIPTHNFMDRWTESVIEIGPMDSVDTEQGVINDRADVMALKTSVKQHKEKRTGGGGGLPQAKKTKGKQII